MNFHPVASSLGTRALGLAVQPRVLPLTLACEGGFSELAGEDGCYTSCWATGRKNALSLLQSLHILVVQRHGQREEP